jgi:tRNA(Ile)-lysidine synthase
MNMRQPRELLGRHDALLVDFPTNRRYLIAVSGGRDSVTLLHQMIALGYSKLVVCHLDHQLRGRSSQADARFLSRLAASHNLICEVARTDVRELARKSKVSIETAARIARFAFLVSVARRRRCHTIFLAHHADDLVETALLNFFRGASPGGIAAMRSVSKHRIGKTELTLARPLLHVWRRQIDAYVQQHNLRFREDASNAQLSATRNRIRHRILPYIKKQFGRDTRASIWRAAQIWSDEETLLDSLIDPALFTTVAIDLRPFRKLPIALQRRAIVRWLRTREIADVGFDLVENIRALTKPDAEVSKVNLPRNRHVRRRGGKLFIE